MKPITFPEVTQTWAENQPPYLPLPAYSDDKETISLWRLSWRERFTILFRGKVWLRQCNFGAPLQPQKVQVECPFQRAPGEP